MGPVVPEDARKEGRMAILEIALPGRAPENAGVLLLDPGRDRLELRLRRDWDRIAEPEDAEVLERLEDDFRRKAVELGAAAFFDLLADSHSNTVRLADPEAVALAESPGQLEWLYHRYVRPNVLPFRTHLPVYSLAAAAGSFGEEMTPEASGWEETPAGMRLSEDMFLATVVGRSMEPLIPDGSLCAFRFNPTGARGGRLLLIENFTAHGAARYTVKRYTSRKAADGESWSHTDIVLEPLNPDYESWRLPPGDFRVVAEFLRVVRPGPQ